MQNIVDLVTIIGSVIGSLGAIGSIFKVLSVFYLKNRSRTKDSLQFTKKLIQSISNKDHPMIIEKCFYGLFGKHLDAKEIKYLVDWENPTDTFNKYLKSKLNLTLKERLEYKALINTKFKRKFFKLLFLFIYLFLALVIFAPLFLSTVDLRFLIIFPILFLGLGPLAYLQVEIFWSIRYAEELVEKEKHAIGKKVK